jgi:hypothetical protein
VSFEVFTSSVFFIESSASLSVEMVKITLSVRRNLRFSPGRRSCESTKSYIQVVLCGNRAPKVLNTLVSSVSSNRLMEE